MTLPSLGPSAPSQCMYPDVGTPMAWVRVVVGGSGKRALQTPGGSRLDPTMQTAGIDEERAKRRTMTLTAPALGPA